MPGRRAAGEPIEGTLRVAKRPSPVLRVIGRNVGGSRSQSGWGRTDRSRPKRTLTLRCRTNHRGNWWASGFPDGELALSTRSRRSKRLSWASSSSARVLESCPCAPGRQCAHVKQLMLGVRRRPFQGILLRVHLLRRINNRFA